MILIFVPTSNNGFERTIASEFFHDFGGLSARFLLAL